MISIITAVHNQLGMNRLYYENLVKHTENRFELIVVDNVSNDGSKEFFEQKGAEVISAEGNYSYPRCQNLGIKKARCEHLVFLNNDVVVSPGWDEKAMQIMRIHQLDIASCCATDHMETNTKTYLHKRKWGIIKKPLTLFGTSYRSLKLMHKLMYWDWEKYTESRYRKFGSRIKEGFVGCNIIMTRRGLKKIGLWDERIQGADFDIFLTAKKRSIETNDIKPIHVLLGIYIHHYIRLTEKGRRSPFVDKDNLISVEEKWGAETANRLLRDSETRL